MIWWIGFNAFVLAMLALDLGVFHRKAHEVSIREALAWSGVWVTLALVFAVGLLLGWWGGYVPEDRQKAALEFLTGYLVEKSLSVDNVFVIALLFTYFQVPARHQHRILFWGILGALVMRAALIFAGIELLRRFHPVVYIFGALLILSGVRMWRAKERKIKPERNPLLKWIRHRVPVTKELRGQKFFVREDGAFTATPLFVVLLFVEWTDLIFAIDSIPAILAITRDPFVVYTSNVMAILGLRALYFALAGIMERFHLLHYGLSILLVFIGVKMLAVDIVKIPTAVSLAVIGFVLALSVILSLALPVRRRSPDKAAARKVKETAR